MFLKYFLIIIGSIPVFLILPLIMAKIFFPKKIKNIIFFPILALLILFYLITIIFRAYFFFPPVTWQNILECLAISYCDELSIILSIEILVSAIITIIKIILSIKSQEKKDIKKFSVILVILAIIFYLGLPCVIFSYIFHYYYKMEDIGFLKKLHKISYKIAVIPYVKGVSADAIALYSEGELYNKYKNNKKIPDYSSPEAKKLIDDYLKYTLISSKISKKNNYLRIAFFYYEIAEYDKAIECINKSDYPNAIRFLADIYSAKGDYDKALDYAMQVDKSRYRLRLLVKIYTGQKQYEKALKELKQERKNSYFYNIANAYIYYNMGEKDLALQYKEKEKEFKDYSLEEFITYMEKTFFRKPEKAN